MALSAPHHREEVYSMSIQLALRFDEVPVTCETQKRYHSIAPCLAGISTPAEQAQALNLGYSTVTRWMREFRERHARPLPGDPVSTCPLHTGARHRTIDLFQMLRAESGGSRTGPRHSPPNRTSASSPHRQDA